MNAPVPATQPDGMRRATALGPGSVTRRVLDNGLVVLVYPNPAIPTVTVRLSVRAGAIYDPPNLSGRAAFTAGALRRGTRRHSFTELNQITEERGLSIGVDSGYHLLDVGGRGLREDADFLLDTMAEVVRKPAFPDDESRAPAQPVAHRPARAGRRHALQSRGTVPPDRLSDRPPV